MLVEFRVTNFRSIKESQCLTFVADKPKKNEDRYVFQSGFKAVPYLSPVAALYGANGAGKSNIIAALDFFQDLLINSTKTQFGDEIPVIPFLFSDETPKQPSEFEIVFVHDGYLFQYGFLVDREKVHDEWLYATPKDGGKQKVQTWMERSSKEPLNKNFIKGERDLWINATRENNLLLATSVQLNSEELKKPFEWLRYHLKVMAKGEISPSFTHEKILEDDWKQDILKFMVSLDASFHDIHATEKNISEDDLDLPDDMPDFIKNDILKNILGKKAVKISTIHKGENEKEYLLPIMEESDGTRRLFAYSAPILDTLKSGFTLIVDEIQSSLHPLALKEIIEMFQCEKRNEKQAQLIFTTHDTNAMTYLHRDDIWLVDKNIYGATALSSMSEFKKKKYEDIERGYLAGRYGAIPSIQETCE